MARDLLSTGEPGQSDLVKFCLSIDSDLGFIDLRGDPESIILTLREQFGSEDDAARPVSPQEILAVRETVDILKVLADDAVQMHGESYEEIWAHRLYAKWRKGFPSKKVQAQPVRHLYSEEVSFEFRGWKYHAFLGSSNFPYLDGCLKNVDAEKKRLLTALGLVKKG